VSNICLIVGTDGTIGSALGTAMRGRGIEVWATSRRDDVTSLKRAIYLDLSEPGRLQLPTAPSSAFLCAARSKFLECEQNSDATYSVNVTGSIAIARHLLSRGVFVVLLSTNAIFDGLTPLPDESLVPSPTTEYGRQKAEAERQLLDLDAGRGDVAIVRLTKVFSSGTPVVRGFMQRLEKGEHFDAFSDLYICPVSVRHIVESLLEIERRRTGGIFHLSGSIELSYADFARRLAGKMGVSPDLVGESTVEESPTPVLYRPRHPALGMKLTSRTIGLHPEPVDSMLANLLAHATSEP
jgi:dTDP-4-dehydrorhamnose reductase